MEIGDLVLVKSVGKMGEYRGRSPGGLLVRMDDCPEFFVRIFPTSDVLHVEPGKTVLDRFLALGTEGERKRKMKKRLLVNTLAGVGVVSIVGIAGVVALVYASRGQGD